MKKALGIFGVAGLAIVLVISLAQAEKKDVPSGQMGVVGSGGMMGRGMMGMMMGGMMGMGGGATAHGAGKLHPVDPNSPSDVMMEACTKAGLGPQGHTVVGRMIDQMHGEGAHHKMHSFMDQM